MTKSRALRGVAGLLVLTACGTTVFSRTIQPAGAPSIEPTSVKQQQLTKGTQQAVNLTRGAPQLIGAQRCATNSDPAHGLTATSMKWGTIIPLTGALRPLGEQTARVMQVAVQYLNAPTGFWRLCDANNSMLAGALGARKLIGIPQGGPA